MVGHDGGGGKGISPPVIVKYRVFNDVACRIGKKVDIMGSEGNKTPRIPDLPVRKLTPGDG